MSSTPTLPTRWLILAVVVAAVAIGFDAATTASPGAIMGLELAVFGLGVIAWTILRPSPSRGPFLAVGFSAMAAGVAFAVLRGGPASIHGKSAIELAVASVPILVGFVLAVLLVITRPQSAPRLQSRRNWRAFYLALIPVGVLSVASVFWGILLSTSQHSALAYSIVAWTGALAIVWVPIGSMFLLGLDWGRIISVSVILASPAVLFAAQAAGDAYMIACVVMISILLSIGLEGARLTPTNEPPPTRIYILRLIPVSAAVTMVFTGLLATSLLLIDL